MKFTFLSVATLLLLAFSSCAPPSIDPATVAVPTGVVSMNYVHAATALAADDFSSAKVALTALADESTGDFQTLARRAADTGDIAAMRSAFKPLSVVATGMEVPEGYSVALCPMFNGGAKWVQRKEKIENPYFGSAMMDCGSFIN